MGGGGGGGRGGSIGPECKCGKVMLPVHIGNVCV